MATQHQNLKVLLSLLTVWSVFTGCDSRRYRLCSEGCCINEYCAYHLICYPKIHCHFGCPDGYCAGNGHERQTTSSTHKVLGIFGNPTRMSKDDRYPTKMPVASESTDTNTGMTLKGGESPYGEGICMPYTPCKEDQQCAMGHSCSFNYNLGYNVCQYNLKIGTTVCFDSRGHLNLKHVS